MRVFGAAPLQKSVKSDACLTPVRLFDQQPRREDAKTTRRPGLRASLNGLSRLLISRLSMKPLIRFCLVASLALVAGCQTGSVDSSLSKADSTKSPRPKDAVMRGVHLMLAIPLAGASQGGVTVSALPSTGAIAVRLFSLREDLFCGSDEL